MHSRTQSVQRGETNRPSWSSNLSMNRLDFRSALVIEESDVLRRSIVEHIKKRGWIVHGVKRAVQAFPVLQHIPYHLIAIGCKASGTTATEFVRIIHESGKWQATRVVVIAGSRGRCSVTEITECGAFLVRRSVWREELSKLLASLDVEKQSMQVSEVMSLDNGARI
jgi:DNA-binding response OmpR family regulator